MATGIAACREGVDGEALHQVNVVYQDSVLDPHGIFPEPSGRVLTPAQNRFINKLPINKDIKIVELFRAHCGRNPKPEENSRYQQQIIGTPISRINRKLKPQSLKIVPGVKRRTYRLIKI